MEEIRIKITGDASALDPTVHKLKEMGTVSEDNKKKFKEAGDAHNKALHETAGEVDRVEGKMRNLAERLVAVFAIEKVLEFKQECVKAFAEVEATTNKLAFAVTKINGESQKSFEELNTQAEELSAYYPLVCCGQVYFCY